MKKLKAQLEDLFSQSSPWNERLAEAKALLKAHRAKRVDEVITESEPKTTSSCEMFDHNTQFSIESMNEGAVLLSQSEVSEMRHAQQVLRAYVKRLYRKNAELRERSVQLAQLSVELTMTEQRERQRISKILHDGLQQQLAAANMLLTDIGDQIEAPGLKDAVCEVGAIISESIHMTRSLSTDLRPPIERGADISAVLNWLVTWMADMHHLKVDLALDACPELHEGIKILVFECIRELLFNTVKHAGTTRAMIRLDVQGTGWIRVVVSDEGRGFDPGLINFSQEKGCGLGLFSIRERIRLIGGRFEIESMPGKGCRSTLVVPKAMAFSGSTAY